MIKKIHFTTLAKCRFISMKLIRDPARDTEAILSYPKSVGNWCQVLKIK